MILLDQVPVSTAPTTLVTIPPGPCSVVLANAGTVGTLYFGTGSGVSSTNGYPLLPSTSLTIPGYSGSAGAAIRAIASAGTIATGVMVSSAQ